MTEAINSFKISRNYIKITGLFLLSKGLFVAMAYSTGIADNTNKCYVGIHAVDFGPGKGNRKSQKILSLTERVLLCFLWKLFCSC